MDNRLRWDKRRSGRTTKMLAAAMRRCFSGRHVYVVVGTDGMFNYCVNILRDMGATKVFHSMRCVEFGEGCRIYFIGLKNALITSDFELRGIHDDNVFWDHDAVRQRYNQILQRFHEYD